MQFVYISGLEHSGTTLLNHLLAQDEACLGLGEVASFFSPAHMRQYASNWGHLDDAFLCSCGKSWSTCPFWGPVHHLCGLVSSDDLQTKYSRLIEYTRSEHGKFAVVIDSSKALEPLQALQRLDVHSRGVPGMAFGLRPVLAVKDARSFAASVARSTSRTASVIGHLRSFNRWLKVNRDLLAAISVPSAFGCSIVLYEELCRQPVQVLNSIMPGRRQQELSVAHNRSHIVMGNKDFLMRNRQAIVYDNSWFEQDAIAIAYALHGPARALNRRIVVRGDIASGMENA